MEDTVILSQLFNTSTPSHTLWLAVATENTTIQEFLSLSKTSSTQNESQNSDLNPYYTALQYYNYINSKQTDRIVSTSLSNCLRTKRNRKRDQPGHLLFLRSHPLLPAGSEGHSLYSLGTHPLGTGTRDR